MKEDDIRLDPEVIATYWAMMGKSPIRHATHKTSAKTTVCGYCGRTELTLTADNMWCEEPCPKNNYPHPIPLSVAELAFFMRDKCEQFTWRHQLALSLKEEVAMSCATPTQWIRAACAAWSQK